MTEPKFLQGFPSFRISVTKSENGQRSIRILSDDDEADKILEGMGLESRFSPQQQADVYIVTEAQVIEFWQRMFGAQLATTSKPKLSDKQRQARAENMRKARSARHS